jgi:SAM-dependent methyltransferase
MGSRRRKAIGDHRFVGDNTQDVCSKFVAESLNALGCKSGLALDIPSGEGRHSRLLARRGMQVVSADLDPLSLERGHVRSSEEFTDRVWSVRVDAMAELPFRAEQFDLVMVVHFQLTPVIEKLIRLIKPGGLLIVETFGAQGENWRALPRAGEIAEALASNFSLVRYQESSVRRRPERVTLRAIALKNVPSAGDFRALSR